MIETYKNTNDEEMVQWTDESGIHSMFKWAYDLQQSAQQNGMVKP